MPLPRGLSERRQPEQGQVIALSGTTGEDYLVSLCRKDSPDLVARPLYRLFRTRSKIMGSASCISEFDVEIPQDLVPDGRFHWRCRTAIKIYCTSVSLSYNCLFFI